jgi:hypothetical protein
MRPRTRVRLSDAGRDREHGTLGAIIGDRISGIASASSVTLDQLLWECFRHFAHLDHANGDPHIGCALQPDHVPTRGRTRSHEPERGVVRPAVMLLHEVLAHDGAYAEDEAAELAPVKDA